MKDQVHNHPLCMTHLLDVLSHVDGWGYTISDCFEHLVVVPAIATSSRALGQLESLFGSRGDRKVSRSSHRHGDLLGLAGHHRQDIKSPCIISAQYGEKRLSAVYSPISSTLPAARVPQPCSVAPPPCLVGPLLGVAGVSPFPMDCRPGSLGSSPSLLFLLLRPPLVPTASGVTQPLSLSSLPSTFLLSSQQCQMMSPCSP